MIKEKQATLVKRLLIKTDEGKLEWEGAVRDGFYQVSFPDYTVQIGIVAGEGGDDDIEIDILGADGEIADGFRDTDLMGFPGAPMKTREGHASWYLTMFELANIARRSAHGADKALDSVLSALDADDEIPF